MKQYSSRIYYLEGDGVTDQPNIFYLLGNKFSILVDAGNSPENYHRLIHELDLLHLPHPSLIVITHWHWDHTFGMCAADCPVIASELTDRQLKTVSGWRWDEASMKRRLESGEDIQFCHDHILVQYSNPEEIRVTAADLTFSGKMTINPGGITCLLEQRDSPHSRDSVLIHIPEEQVLIGGDAQYEDYYDNDGKYDPARLGDFLEYLKEIPFRDYLKSHDSPFISKEELLLQLEESLLMAV